MKVLNVFAIILAWVLSIVMVFMLIAAPLTLSALSLLNTENIVGIVSQMLVGSNQSAAARPQEGFVVQNLSAETEPTTEANPENAAGGINMDGLKELLGDDVSEETINKVLTSDAVTEILTAYTNDLTNAMVGKNAPKQFTAEFLVEVVQENLDEIVEIVDDSGASLTDEQKQQLKDQIKTAVEENAEKIVEEIPAPEELKESLTEGNEDLELALAILARKDQIKGVVVGVIVLLSAMIFGLRYPGLRGMRWLSTNLFTAGGINIIISFWLGMASAALNSAAEGLNAIDGTAAANIVDALFSQLAKGVIVRTIIILVAAVALLVGYIVLKSVMKRKKMIKTMEDAGVAFVPEAVPAFETAQVTVEQEAVAEEPAEEPAPAEEV